jgi:hypothetical protein
MPTFVFTPDASPESTSVDGYAARFGVNETFNTIRGGAGTLSQDSASSEEVATLEATGTTDQYQTMLRGFFLFDTSILTATAIIVSATFSLQINSVTNTFSQSLGLIISSPSSNTAIVNADYLNITRTRLASDIALGSLTTGAYNTWSLNATGIAQISKTGITKFATALSGDIDNTAPTWVSGQKATVIANYADAGANKPTLTVITAGGLLGTEI